MIVGAGVGAHSPEKITIEGSLNSAAAIAAMGKSHYSGHTLRPH